MSNTRANFLNTLGKLIHSHPIRIVIQAVNHIAFLTTSGLYSSTIGHIVSQNGITTML